ncbi:MAG: glycosyltransferase family 4 protein [Ignavibacteria bacterium]|nr:glycosyltransferase family 4 protein [Ignavibacteria bacterium]MBI3766310.1 glycosyltransferase family 4 protein [Ignavibacteriales bacterium]
MSALKFLVDARGTQAGFKHHKHRGIGHYAKNLLQRFPILYPDHKFYYLVDRDLPIDLPIRDGSVEWVKHRSNRSLTSLSKFFEPQITLPRSMRSGRFDVVHYLSHEDAALATPAPYIVTLHDIIPLVTRELYDPLRRMKRAVTHLFVRRIVARSAAIITSSEHSKSDIIKYFAVPAEKITVIPLAVEEQYFKEHSITELDKVRHKYQLPHDFLLYVGGIDPRKNIRTMLKALSLLTDKTAGTIPLAFAGDITKQREYPEMVALLKDLRLEHRVKLLGYVVEEDLPALYAAARAFIFPSLYEGFGLPILQAMAAGTPVIAAMISSIPEVAGEAAINVDSYDPASIANGICALLDNHALADGKKNAGKLQARKFSWDQTARQVVDVYVKVHQQSKHQN